MPPFAPIKRKELIRQLRKLGFSGPLVGGNHQYMVQGKLKIWIPNPHQGRYSVKACWLKFYNKQILVEKNGKNYVKQFCLGKVKNCYQLSKMNAIEKGFL